MTQYTFPPCELPAGAPVVAYARVSPGPRQDIASQKDYLTAYVQYYSLNLVYLFEDRALSGGSVAGRDALAELVEFVTGPTAPQLAAILFYNTSRMARDMDDAQQVSSLLRQHGQRIIFIQNPTPAGSVGRIVEAAYFFADDTFRKQLRDQVVRGHKMVRQLTGKDGTPLGVYAGRIPFGYLAEKIDTGMIRNNGDPRIVTRILPDPQLAPKIVEAYHLRARGWTYRQIEQKLKLFGYDLDRCTPEEKTACVNLYKGLFRRPVYKGEYVYNEKVYLEDGQRPPDGAEEKTVKKQNRLTGGYTVKRYWEKSQTYKNFVTPIVSPDLWDAVQKQHYNRPKKGDKWPKDRHAMDGTSKLFILSGLLYCDHCGKKMYTATQYWGDKTYRYHACSTRMRRTVAACPNRNISAPAVESAVVDHIFGFIDEEIITATIHRVNELLIPDEGDLPGLQEKAERLTRQRERLLALVMDGDQLAESRYRLLGFELQQVEAEIDALVKAQWTSQPITVTGEQVWRFVEEIRAGLKSDQIEVKRRTINDVLFRAHIIDQGQRFVRLKYKNTILGIGEDLATKCYSTKQTLLNSEILSFTVPIETTEENPTEAGQ